MLFLFSYCATSVIFGLSREGHCRERSMDGKVFGHIQLGDHNSS